MIPRKQHIVSWAAATAIISCSDAFSTPHAPLHQSIVSNEPLFARRTSMTRTSLYSVTERHHNMPLPSSAFHHHHDESSSSLHGSPATITSGRWNQHEHPSSTVLPAVAIAVPMDYGYEQREQVDNLKLFSSMKDFLLPVVSASFLITGNTVGASCLVLPELASQVGMGVTSAIFLGAYVMNLISGLVIAEVTIRQRESSPSSSQVPSSFKEVAFVNLESEWAANAVSSISLFVNTCVMSFNLIRAGQVSGQLLGVEGMDGILSIVEAAALVGLLTTQANSKLSHVASMAVTALLVAFGGMLLPNLLTILQSGGVAGMESMDPHELLWGMTKGIDGSSIAKVAPVFLTTCIYQNIVPSVTKILNYDRSKTVASLVLGSMIPVAMYWMWCFTALSMDGGGDVPSVMSVNPLWNAAFSVAAVVGSSIGCSMCLAEEINTFFHQPSAPAAETFEPSFQEEEESLQVPVTLDVEKDDKFSFGSALLSLGVPLAAGLALTNGDGDFTTTLRVAGSFGSPLLYGVLPAVMAWKQRDNLSAMLKQVPTPSVPKLPTALPEQLFEQPFRLTMVSAKDHSSQHLVPGGFFSLGMLGMASTGFTLQELGNMMTEAGAIA